jgi:hypothetical protein
MERKKAPYTVISEDQTSKILRKPCGCTRQYHIETMRSQMLYYCSEHGIIFSELDDGHKELFDDMDKLLVNIALRKPQANPKISQSTI